MDKYPRQFEDTSGVAEYAWLYEEVGPGGL